MNELSELLDCVLSPLALWFLQKAKMPVGNELVSCSLTLMAPNATPSITLVSTLLFSFSQITLTPSHDVHPGPCIQRKHMIPPCQSNSDHSSSKAKCYACKQCNPKWYFKLTPPTPPFSASSSPLSSSSSPLSSPSASLQPHPSLHS